MSIPFIVAERAAKHLLERTGLGITHHRIRRFINWMDRFQSLANSCPPWDNQYREMQATKHRI